MLRGKLSLTLPKHKMNLYRVKDIDFEEVLNSTYDISFFSSGFEKRCTFVPEKINPDRKSNLTLFGFKDEENDAQRIENDKYYKIKWSIEPTIALSNDDSQIYKTLNESDSTNKDEIKILVDYTSMSRTWYAGILNWAKFSNRHKQIQIDFTYSVGLHIDGVPQMFIDAMYCIPGCEGQPMGALKSVAVFILGFDGLAPLCMMDLLEPDITYACIATGHGNSVNLSKAVDANKEFLDSCQEKNRIYLPIESVEDSFGKLAEVVIPHLDKQNVSFVPMGPKPLILTSILLSMRFNKISCLYVRGKSNVARRVDASGQITSTRITFRK